MSKSAENDASRINLTDSPDVISSKVKRCKTDAVDGLEFDNPDRPEAANLLTIYQLCSGKTKVWALPPAQVAQSRLLVYHAMLAATSTSCSMRACTHAASMLSQTLVESPQVNALSPCQQLGG